MKQKKKMKVKVKGKLLIKIAGNIGFLVSALNVIGGLATGSRSRQLDEIMPMGMSWDDYNLILIAIMGYSLYAYFMSVKHSGNLEKAEFLLMLLGINVIAIIGFGVLEYNMNSNILFAFAAVIGNLLWTAGCIVGAVLNRKQFIQSAK
ncbi:MAG: hypothetical protein FWC79_06340 [Oscillospiraceae bacterium]|nr:hypothetical protein [Oscillospiraceae bacterium]